MSAEIAISFDVDISLSEKRFLTDMTSQVVRYALKSEGYNHPDSEVSILFTGDEFITFLNKKYRGENHPTDVLCFSMTETNSKTDELNMPEIPKQLGDIVISLDAAANQADAEGVTLRREVALLLVHGILHLLGYDHDKPQNEAVMWAKQSAILNALEL